MGLTKIHGKYVFWSTDWTGGYDCNYVFAATWQGPYRGKIRVLPHGGKSSFFEDKDGNWWHAVFVLNTNEWTTRAKTRVRLNLTPLDVRNGAGITSGLKSRQE